MGRLCWCGLGCVRISERANDGIRGAAQTSLAPAPRPRGTVWSAMIVPVFESHPTLSEARNELCQLGLKLEICVAYRAASDIAEGVV